MAIPPEVEGLPEWSQKVLGGLAFLGVIGAMVTRFLGKGSEPDDHKTVVLERAETADLGVLRKLISDLDPLPDVLDEVRRVISNQDRNYGVLDRLNTAVERVATLAEGGLSNQRNFMPAIDRVARQLDQVLENQRELIELARRADRAREMREEVERLFRNSERQVPPLK